MFRKREIARDCSKLQGTMRDFQEIARDYEGLARDSKRFQEILRNYKLTQLLKASKKYLKVFRKQEIARDLNNVLENMRDCQENMRNSKRFPRDYERFQEISSLTSLPIF